jgi:hypothetical protein
MKYEEEQSCCFSFSKTCSKESSGCFLPQEQERVIEENRDPVEDQPQEQERVIEENVDNTPSNLPTDPVDDAVPPPPTHVYDGNHLPQDPGERLPIHNYPVNEQDAVRREYIIKGPFQPYAYEFPKRRIRNRERLFNFVYSILCSFISIIGWNTV